MTQTGSSLLVMSGRTQKHGRSISRHVLHGEEVMYRSDTQEDAPRMQDSKERNIVHFVHKVLQVFIGKFMTPNHGNYERNNHPYLRRV